MKAETIKPTAPPTMPIHFVVELNFFALWRKKKSEKV
jgi:hypothetical protein